MRKLLASLLVSAAMVFGVPAMAVAQSAPHFHSLTVDSLTANMMGAIANATDPSNAASALTALGGAPSSTLLGAIASAPDHSDAAAALSALGGVPLAGGTMTGALITPNLTATDRSSKAANSVSIVGGATTIGLVQNANVQPSIGGTAVSPFIATTANELGRTVTPQDFGALCNGSFAPTYNGTTGQQIPSIGAGTLGSGHSPLGNFGATTPSGGIYPNYGGTSVPVLSFPAASAYPATGVNFGLNPTDTQDWAAIQAALGYLSGTGGGKLDFPTGSACQINRFIYVPSNVELYFARGASITAYPAANTLNDYVEEDTLQVWGSNVEIDGGTINGGGLFAQANGGANPAIPPQYAATSAGQIGGVVSGLLPFPSTATISPGWTIMGPGFPAPTHLAPTPYRVACTAGVAASGTSIAVVNGTSGGTAPVNGDIMQLGGGSGNVATTATAIVSGGVLTGLTTYNYGIYATPPTGIVALTDLTTAGVTGLTAAAPTYKTISPAVCGLNQISVTLNGVTQNTSTVINAGANYVFNSGFWEGWDNITTTAQATQDTTAESPTLTAQASSGQPVIAVSSTAGLSNGMFVFNSQGNSGIPTGATVASISGSNVTLSANLTATIASGTPVIFTAANGMSGSLLLPSAIFGNQQSQGGNTVAINKGDPVWAISPQGVPYEIPDTEVTCVSEDGSQGGTTGGNCTGPYIWFTNVNGAYVYPNIPDAATGTAGLTPGAIPSGTTLNIGGIQALGSGIGIHIEPGANNDRVHDMEILGTTANCVLAQGTNFKLSHNISHDCWFAGLNTYGNDGGGVLQLAGPGLIDGNTVYNPAMYNQATMNGPGQPFTQRRVKGGNGARGQSFPGGFDGIGLNLESQYIRVLGNYVLDDDIIVGDPCDTQEQQAYVNAGSTCANGAYVGSLIEGNVVNSDGDSYTDSGTGRGYSFIGNFATGTLTPLRGGQVSAGIGIYANGSDLDLTIAGNHIGAATGVAGIYVTGNGTYAPQPPGGITIKGNIIHDFGNGTGSGIELHQVGAGVRVEGNSVCDDQASKQMQYAIDTNGAFNGAAAGNPVLIKDNTTCAGARGALNLQTGATADQVINSAPYDAPGLTATGTSCTAGPLVLPGVNNEITGGSGLYVQIPAWATTPVHVFNRNAGSITVCPPPGGTLDGGSVNAGASLATATAASYLAITGTKAYTVH